MDGDGTQNGYDLHLTESVTNIVNIPVIASGGAGCLEDIYDVFNEGRASAALLASLLHDKKLSLREIKTFEEMVELADQMREKYKLEKISNIYSSSIPNFKSYLFCFIIVNHIKFKCSNSY